MEINHSWCRLNYLPQISHVNRFGTSNQLSFLLKILNYACGWQTKWPPSNDAAFDTAMIKTCHTNITSKTHRQYWPQLFLRKCFPTLAPPFTTPAQGPGSCPDDSWIPYSEHCYFFETFGVDWKDAQVYCSECKFSFHFMTHAKKKNKSMTLPWYDSKNCFAFSFRMISSF